MIFTALADLTRKMTDILRSSKSKRMINKGSAVAMATHKEMPADGILHAKPSPDGRHGDRK